MKSEAGDSISLIQAQQCPHLFFNPSMTYFNGSHNLEIIESIKKQIIEITEEVTEFNSKGEVDKIILRDSRIRCSRTYCSNKTNMVNQLHPFTSFGGSDYRKTR